MTRLLRTLGNYVIDYFDEVGHYLPLGTPSVPLLLPITSKFSRIPIDTEFDESGVLSLRVLAASIRALILFVDPRAKS